MKNLYEQYSDDEVRSFLKQSFYRKIDSNERIQKALSQQTYGYIDETYNMGDVVLFKEVNTEKMSMETMDIARIIRIRLGSITFSPT